MALFSWMELPAVIYNLLGFLYLVNALHHEGMQWAIAQCTFLSHTFSLLSILWLISYWQNGKKIFAFLAGAMIPLAAFAYGNGLATIGFIIIISIYLFLTLKKTKLCGTD